MKRSAVWHLPKLVEFRKKATAYQQARRDAARLRGDCSKCGRRSAVGGSVRCAECQAKNRRDPGDLYVPLDEVLAKPRIRILRQLRHHDWTIAVELLDLIGTTSASERNRYACVLGSAVVAGLVERRDRFGTFEYRITQAGRAALRAAFDSYEQRLGEGVAA